MNEVIKATGENKLAYICSPYRGNIFKKKRNVIYARRLTKAVVDLGYTPITTHLYLTMVFNDRDPNERRRGMNAGKEILKHCETIVIGVRYGVSPGMKSEIEAAEGKNTIIII
jgi:hypothetical protein